MLSLFRNVVPRRSKTILRAWRATASALLAGALTAATAAQAGVIRDDRSQQDYLSLGASNAYASVGRLDITRDQPGYVGSGTLISDRWVLTAAHLLESTSSLKFTVGGHKYAADGWVVDPKFKGDVRRGYDLALVKLSSPVDGVAPAERYRGKREQGSVATFVGFGRTGTGSAGVSAFDNQGYDGQKRAGTNVIDAGLGKKEKTYKSKLSKSDRVFVADFDNPSNAAENVTGAAEPTNLEYLISWGDSGGGAFIDVDGKSVLAGVHSFGEFLDNADDSDYGDTIGDVRVSAFNKWIDQILKLDGKGRKISKYITAAAAAATTPSSTSPRELDPPSVLVPEPASFGLLALGAAGLLVRRSRRR